MGLPKSAIHFPKQRIRPRVASLAWKASSERLSEAINGRTAFATAEGSEKIARKAPLLLVLVLVLVILTIPLRVFSSHTLRARVFLAPSSRPSCKSSRTPSSGEMHLAGSSAGFGELRRT